MPEIIGQLLAIVIMVYGCLWLVESKEFSSPQKGGILALVALIAIAFCGGGKR